jgi:hypothetical protein
VVLQVHWLPDVKSLALLEFRQQRREIRLPRTVVSRRGGKRHSGDGHSQRGTYWERKQRDTENIKVVILLRKEYILRGQLPIIIVVLMS